MEGRMEGSNKRQRNRVEESKKGRTKKYLKRRGKGKVERKIIKMQKSEEERAEKGKKRKGRKKDNKDVEK